MIRLITLSGKLRIGTGNQPAVDIEKDAADRVKGRSQLIFSCNSFCAGVMDSSLRHKSALAPF
jgi:hypothetical protein